MITLAIISAVLIILAAAFNAVMDSVENEHIHSTIWADKKKWEWWYKRESWDNAKRIMGWKFDGWHTFKSLMIFALLFIPAMLIQLPITGVVWVDLLLRWMACGLIWNGTFNIFYNHIFITKNKKQ